MTIAELPESSAPSKQRFWKHAAWFTVPPAVALGLTWLLLWRAWGGPSLLIALGVLLLAPWSVAAGNILSLIAIADRIKTKAGIGWGRLMVGPVATVLAVILAAGMLIWAAYRPVEWTLVIINTSGQPLIHPRLDLDGHLGTLNNSNPVAVGTSITVMALRPAQKGTMYAEVGTDTGALTALASLPAHLTDGEAGLLLATPLTVTVTVAPEGSAVTTSGGQAYFSQSHASTQPAALFTHTHLR